MEMAKNPFSGFNIFKPHPAKMIWALIIIFFT